jgi:tRNA (cytidine/uridine-2'-O-)-methyltransferase
MFRVALWQPEIPPNTGNVARLCAATGADLHLIGRLGFRLDDRSLRRAGLDYWPAVRVTRHPTLADFEASHDPDRLWCFSARAPGAAPYTSVTYEPGDALLFGSETQGLPPTVLERYAGQVLTVPMPGGGVRSLNLATTVAIVLYEALRQQGLW